MAPDRQDDEESVEECSVHVLQDLGSCGKRHHSWVDIFPNGNRPTRLTESVSGLIPSDSSSKLNPVCRSFSVFFIIFLVNAIVNTILLRFFFAGLYWEYREGPSKIYSWVALCNASIIAEMPGALVCGVVYYLLWYFPSGLPLGGTAGYVFLAVLTYEVFQVGIPILA